MPEQTYPFVVFKDTHGRILRPPSAFIPIRILNPRTSQALITIGQIDTGADECTFPAGIATALGHNLQADGVKSDTTIGVSGATKVFKHTFKIQILSPTLGKAIATSPEMLVSCVASQIPPLLGVRNCLARFCVTVDYRKRITRLSW